MDAEEVDVEEADAKAVDMGNMMDILFRIASVP